MDGRLKRARKVLVGVGQLEGLEATYCEEEGDGGDHGDEYQALGPAKVGLEVAFADRRDEVGDAEVVLADTEVAAAAERVSGKRLEGRVPFEPTTPGLKGSECWPNC